MTSAIYGYSSSGAFNPTGKTCVVTGGGSSVKAALSVKCSGAQIYNAGSTVAFVAFGDAAIVATAASDGTPGDMPVAPGAVIVVGVPASAVQVAVIGGTGAVYITPGTGGL